jgi:uncharacterized protein DUF3616
MIPFSAHFALDYRDAAREPKLLHNLSAVAVAGRFLWTASDEGRSLECLEPDGDGYRLRRQYRLDSLFPDLPGKEEDCEADLEALAVSDDGHLWICGSHCRVRKKMESPNCLSDRIIPRISRQLLGRVKLTDNGGKIEDFGCALPFEGPGDLREALAKNKFLEPFLELPSKENGLDIEGMAVAPDGKLLFGLRGPLFDSFAVVVSVEVEARKRGRLQIKKRTVVLHFLDLGGLGVRDLTRSGDEMFVLAGPVSSAPAPFRIYRWKPRDPTYVQRPVLLHEWAYSWGTSTPAEAPENPEGLSVLDHGRPGLLVLFDSPRLSRIEGTRYFADWGPIPGHD